MPSKGNDIAADLRATIKARGLVYKQVAAQLGVHPVTVAKWVTGQQGIHPLRVAMVREWIETTTRRER